MADIADAPGGLLLVPDDYGRLGSSPPALELAGGAAGGRREPLIRFLEPLPVVLDFGSVRDGWLARRRRGRRACRHGSPDRGRPGPACRCSTTTAGRASSSSHPPVRRPLDWEDFDLFRTAGIQAASYLAEARTQEALANAQRFDEFNRRFAFIMHDIKNLVSQLSLIIRNAERHADKPEFREDMIATLQSSVKKMNDLLARLSRAAIPMSRRSRCEAMPVDRCVAAVAEIKGRVHPVEVAASGPGGDGRSRRARAGA
jgi:signal transduction histidine kinase